jgi:D-hexose-6-phosphate mutarotase
MQARVEGLQGLTYRDNLQNLKEEREDRPAVTIGGEVDRIYAKAPDTIKVREDTSVFYLILTKARSPVGYSQKGAGQK